MEVTVKEFTLTVCVKVEVLTIGMCALILVLIRSPLLHLTLSNSLNCKAGDCTNKASSYFCEEQLTTDEIVHFPVENGVFGIELCLQYSNDEAKTGD